MWEVENVECAGVEGSVSRGWTFWDILKAGSRELRCQTGRWWDWEGGGALTLG